MVEIKICGMKSVEDALCAASAGANAIGFIFHKMSLRYLSPPKAREIIGHLPSEIVKVGVFVNENPDEIKRIIDLCGLDLIQLHGDESPRYCALFGPSLVIKAVFLRTEDDLLSLGRYRVRAFLADARDKDRYGGTGKKSDWTLAAKAAENYSLVLAGGLNEENIAGAIKAVSPRAVDINSGIEISPGVKDHERMRRIIAVAKNTQTANREFASSPAAVFAKREKIKSSLNEFEQ